MRPFNNEGSLYDKSRPACARARRRLDSYSSQREDATYPSRGSTCCGPPTGTGRLSREVGCFNPEPCVCPKSDDFDSCMFERAVPTEGLLMLKHTGQAWGLYIKVNKSLALPSIRTFPIHSPPNPPTQQSQCRNPPFISSPARIVA